MRGVRDGQVELHGVRHSYRGAPPVLLDLDLAVSSGQVLVVHGRNGAGKTTLLRVMAGVLHPRAGRVARRGRLGYLPQRSDEPPPRLSAAAWLGALANMAGDGRGGDRLDALRRLGVDHASVPMDTLSVGSAAKVLLAAAVGGAPDVLVLDEPYAALDAAARDVTSTLIAAAARDGAAVVVSDHDGAATAVATHVATIADGRVSLENAAAPPARVHVVGIAPDGTTVDRIVSAGERDESLLHLLRGGGHVLRVEDVP